jgi:PAS domain S-box-containing protein
VEEKLNTLILNSISDGVFTVDRNCIITSFNRAAEDITGFAAGEALGAHCFEVFRTDICHKHCALKDTLKSREPVENARVTIITKEGCEIPIRVTTTLLTNGDGQIAGAVEFFKDISELEHLKEHLHRSNVLMEIITANREMQRLIGHLPDIAQSDCSVLIQGSSGVGKELFAQAIHNLSPRRYAPYIRMNCAALPPNLLESELFGFEKGAFTDAKKSKPGQFCLADGGTLLLDEIAEMDLSLQVKLLRVLNNGEYRPLGSAKTLRADVRIVASTNADLEMRMREGRFREDLYFRIHVVSLRVPPLRERPEDIPILAEHFIQRLRKKTGKPISAVSPEAIACLRGYPFPGNVRELENAIEHGFVMCHGESIETHHLPPHIIERKSWETSSPPRQPDDRAIIEESLRRNLGNRTKVARELGIHRSTLWRKMKGFRIPGGH